MPDLLIRMEMPRNCFECPLFTNCDACEGHECGCGLLGGIGYEEDISEDRRRDDCPLVELPEHGDLIDRDAFDADARKRYCSACNNYNGTKCRACWVDDMLGDVADFETVIPSNKEETK